MIANPPDKRKTVVNYSGKRKTEATFEIRVCVLSA
jgi:hypothetical protein